MNKEELKAEIERVKVALQKTTSWKLKHDYGKHLKRMQNDLRYYEEHYGKRTEFASRRV